MFGARLPATLCGMDDVIIEREEVIALLFNVSDIAESLRNIEGLLRGDDGEEEETD